MNQQKRKKSDIAFDIFYKAALVLLGLLVTLVVYFIIVLIIASRDMHCDYKDYDNTGISIAYDIDNCPYETKQEVKAEIDKLFGQPFYFYIEKDLGRAIGGRTHPELFIVAIHSKLPLFEYTFTLTHELVHLSQWTLNETYTEFEAFKILYESDNPWLQECAKWEANYRIQTHEKNAYDCGYWILEYLGDKK